MRFDIMSFDLTRQTLAEPGAVDLLKAARGRDTAAPRFFDYSLVDCFFCYVHGIQIKPFFFFEYRVHGMQIKQ